jgi:2-keto-4-pentenoate hydratase/2-oxohepta-3-ene-1,7-dioic acid hydratase in catechol pathway
MRLVTFVHAGQQQTGLLLAEQVLPLARAATAAGIELDTTSVLAIVRGGVASLQSLVQLAARADEFKSICVALNAVQLLAPIPQPVRNVFCVGRNYVDHIKEGMPGKPSEISLPPAPQFFTKATHAVNAPQGEVPLHAAVTRRLDYEVELAVIIGKGGRDIQQEQAFDHVFGYCVANDITARDLQRRHEQWFKGKSLDGTLPLGPSLVTRDEVADVRELQLTLHVNGELRQQAHVAQMIFDIPAIIASLSAGLTLEPGDIIATGTPSGVGFAMEPPNYLKQGDVVVARIEGLGELRNRIVAG